mmetsp:Transcript_12577/g.14429  ORF Transcript_12577/g.14429 Transcript_12577/m.14429 type:complete len:279 (-) Transcript_12577:462-1298(-)
MPPTPLRDDNDTQSVARTPGPAFGGHTQSVMGTLFGGNERPMVGTPTTTAHSVASSQIGRIDLPTLELFAQSPNNSTAQETDMAAVEDTPAQAPPSGAGSEVSGNSVNDTLLFESAPDAVRTPSIPGDFQEDVHLLMKEEQDPEDEKLNIGDQAVIRGTEEHVRQRQHCRILSSIFENPPPTSDDDNDAASDDDNNAASDDDSNTFYLSKLCVSTLYRQLIEYPAKIIPLMNFLLNANTSPSAHNTKTKQPGTPSRSVSTTFVRSPTSNNSTCSRSTR